MNKQQEKRIRQLKEYVSKKRNTSTSDKMNVLCTNVLAYIILIEDSN